MKHLAGWVLLFAVAGATAQPAPATTPSPDGQVFTELLNWHRVNGSARQLSISSNGAVLALGRGGEAWQWKGRGQWGRLPGSFDRLALDNTNVPWGIAADGRILRYQGSYWTELPGRASEIAGGADGSMWIVQPDGQPAQWSTRERQWQVRPFAGKVRQLAIAPSGEPWAIAESGRVHRRVGAGWDPMPEVDATSMAIGPEGSVFLAGVDHRLRRWDASGKRWETLNGVAASVAVGPLGRPWVTTPEDRILASAFFDDMPDSQVNTVSTAAANAEANNAAWFGQLSAVVGASSGGGGAPRGRAHEPLEFRKVEGKARDLGIGADGSVFVVTYDGSLARWSNTRSAFVAFTGQFARVAVAPNGNPWGITLAGDVFRHDGVAWWPVRYIKAQDIAIGFDGTVIVADLQAFLHRYDAASDAFTRLSTGPNGVPPRGRRLAVTPSGHPWLISEDGFVVRCENTACERLPTQARSLDIGPEGSIVIVDANRILRRWNEREESFERLDSISDPIDLVAVGPRGKPWLLSTSAEVWASEFFPRDERRDATTVATTEALIKAGVASPPAFSFTVNMSFEKLANLDPPFQLASEAGTLQMAINPSTGRATLIDASHQFFNYDEATRTLARDTAIPPLPTPGEIQSFMISKDGAYWVTSSLAWSATVWRYQSSRWAQVPSNWGTILMHTPITVSEAVDGTVYASGPDGQLYRYDRQSNRFVRMTMPLPNGQISKVVIDTNGRLWVGSNGTVPGLYEHLGGRWVLRLPGTPQASFMEACVLMAYTCFANGANGSVYTVNTSESVPGLQRWNAGAGSWDRLSGSPNLSLRGVYAIGIDGRPWAIQRVPTGRGVGLYRAR